MLLFYALAFQMSGAKAAVGVSISVLPEPKEGLTFSTIIEHAIVQHCMPPVPARVFSKRQNMQQRNPYPLLIQL